MFKSFTEHRDFFFFAGETRNFEKQKLQNFTKSY